MCVGRVNRRDLFPFQLCNCFLRSPVLVACALPKSILEKRYLPNGVSNVFKKLVLTSMTCQNYLQLPLLRKYQPWFTWQSILCCWIRLTKFSEVLQSVVYVQNKVLLLQMRFLQQPWMMSKSVGVVTGMFLQIFSGRNLRWLHSNVNLRNIFSPSELSNNVGYCCFDSSLVRGSVMPLYSSAICETKFCSFAGISLFARFVDTPRYWFCTCICNCSVDYEESPMQMLCFTTLMF